VRAKRVRSSGIALEVIVTPGLRTAVLVPTLSALLLAPVAAEAQHRAVNRVPPARASVAVPRQGGRYSTPYYRPYYYRPYYYRPYAYYDPFFYGSFSFGIGFGAPYGYGYPYGYYGYGYGYPYSSPYYGAYSPYGPGYYGGGASLHLQVTPRETQVYIDGYYAGVVDQFDGTFQRLYLEPGQHDLQLYLPGHRTYSQKVYLQPANTFTVRYAMPPLTAGDPEPVRPTPPTPPPSQGYGPPPPSRRPPARSAPPPQSDRDEDQNRVSAERSELGTLALRVQPGDAAITIDGERWQGPADGDRLVIQMPPGTHNVEIRRDGYRTYITDINVRHGESTPLNVALTKQ
jgi:PEGA domain-containing protein